MYQRPINALSSLLRTSFRPFSQEQKKNKVLSFVQKAWKQTFPNQEEVVRERYQKVKQQKRFTKQQLQKIQTETPQYLRSALVSRGQAKVQKEGFTLSSLIPETIKSKVKQTAQYKEYAIFKENLKEYASTREGVIANVGATAYSHLSQGSQESRATQIMREYIPEFSIYTLEQQSTVIFKTAYHSFLSEKLSQLETMASEQGYEHFLAFIKMNKSKKWRPNLKEIVFNYPAQLARAKIGQKQLPSFQFTIKIMEQYCFVDYEGKIVEGGEDRFVESVYQFTLIYNGQHVEMVGHPWSICEVKKLDELKMLV